MINIEYYQQVYEIKQKLKDGALTPGEAFQYFNSYHERYPVVFSIETTNVCNMTCKMCPRTTQMARPMGTMSMQLFKKIVDQLRPWKSFEWNRWKAFVKEKYKVEENEMSENNFFLYIVPKVLTLHGYGEPLLDKYIVERVEYLTKNNIPSYFSCNPYNITFEKGKKLLQAGLTYLKFSADNIKLFENNIQDIKSLIFNNEFGTTFVMDIVGSPKDYEKLQEMFKDYDVYMYNKSKDNQWFNKDTSAQKSIHWLEPCQFPWSSMSIMWDGTVVPCGQDFNNEMIMGDANRESLYHIWNGMNYYLFRKNHLLKETNIKCFDRCDMKVIGSC